MDNNLPPNNNPSQQPYPQQQYPPPPQYAPPPPQYAPPPPALKRKKGYVAPIVWLIIGGVFCAVWAGIPIVIIALIVLSSRVSYNKKVEVENAQIMMQYSAQYGGQPPYNV